MYYTDYVCGLQTLYIHVHVWGTFPILGMHAQRDSLGPNSWDSAASPHKMAVKDRGYTTLNLARVLSTKAIALSFLGYL